MTGGFDEAWLKAHEAKMAATKSAPATLPAPAPPDDGIITFTLPRAIPLLNELLRMHWSMRRKYQQSLSAEIAQLISHALGRTPLERATVTITRYSVGTPDHDGCTPKSLLDCLLVRSATHPAGLGLLIDDSPAHLTLRVIPVVCATRKEQRTEVKIEPFRPPGTPCFKAVSASPGEGCLGFVLSLARARSRCAGYSQRGALRLGSGRHLAPLPDHH